MYSLKRGAASAFLLLAFLVSTYGGIFAPVPVAAADGPAVITVVNAARAQWDESPVLACVKDDAGALMPGVVVTATLTSLTPNTQVLTTGADGCLSLPVKGFLSTTADRTDLGVLTVKNIPAITVSVVVTITGPKPDMTGWIPGTDVFFSKFDANPEAAKWAKDNATVFVQVAHPVVDFSRGRREYGIYATPLPVGTAVKIFGITRDAKWVDIVIATSGWDQNHYYFPAGALSEKWPFAPAGTPDVTGYVPGTPWNWTDGTNPAVVAAHQKGQRDFFVRTAFGEIYEGDFFAQRRVYGRSLSVDEKITVVDITSDERWARIEHTKGGPRFFVPTAVLSPGWTDSVRGQTSVTYTVVKGDTLTRIAKHYGVTVNALVTANGIAHPNLIRIGQVLTIPAPTAP